jgi:hypothetical protein
LQDSDQITGLQSMYRRFNAGSVCFASTLGIPELMRERAIRSVRKRDIHDDEGRFRLSFFSTPIAAAG